jgi:cell division septum initiation protein DivIVA
MYTREFISTITKVIQDIAEENNQLKQENKQLKAKIFRLEAAPIEALFAKMPPYPESGSDEQQEQWWKDYHDFYKALLSKMVQESSLEKE